MVAHTVTQAHTFHSSILLSQDLSARIVNVALEASPEECCGILIGNIQGPRSVVTRVFPTKNVWKGDKTRRYEIDPAATFSILREVRESDMEVVGFYHSHTNGSQAPSAYDVRMAWPGMSYVIVAVQDGSLFGLQSWRLSADGYGMVPEVVN